MATEVEMLKKEVAYAEEINRLIVNHNKTLGELGNCLMFIHEYASRLPVVERRKFFIFMKEFGVAQRDGEKDE